MSQINSLGHTYLNMGLITGQKMQKSFKLKFANTQLEGHGSGSSLSNQHVGVQPTAQNCKLGRKLRPRYFKAYTNTQFMQVTLLL